MEQLELEYMNETMHRGPMNRTDETWIKAFHVFNNETKQNKQMNCAPCYFVVYRYFYNRNTKPVN